MTAQPSIAERRKSIENIYPLAPMQEGLLFHAVLAPEAGVYMPQVVLHVTGDIDAPTLQAAWREAIRRHGVLRSGFFWEERDTPFQVVFREAPLAWQALDWSDAGEEVQGERLAQLLAANRAEGFDLRRPPLMRIQWIKRGAGSYSLVLCYHHLILDGWSASRLIRDVFLLYQREKGADAPALSVPRPYADYIAWLKKQDGQGAHRYWQSYLAGSEPCHFLPATSGTSGFARRERAAPAPLVKALRGQCQQLGITVNTLLQGALGLLIAGRTGRDDVIFGATTAGRPATLEGATEMVGLFINTLPVRMMIDREASLGAWLIALQARQALADQHGHLPLREIQGGHGALFDCLLVFESYPVSTDLGGVATFRLAGVAFDEWTHYPLTLLAASDDEGLKVTARYARDALDAAAVDLHLSELGRLLKAMVASPQTALHRFLGERPAETPRPSAPRPGGPSAAWPEPATSDHIALTTDTERMLAAAWGQVLKRTEPGAGDHFFALGGDSLLAVRVISRVRRELGIELPVRALFDRPVLSDLAAYIDALRASSGGPAPHHREIEI
jgi:acyl carrier protein